MRILNAVVFNVEPTFNKSSFGTLTEIAVDAKQTFINNGTSTIVELYEVGRHLTERVEFELSEGFRSLISVAETVKSVTEKKVVDKIRAGLDLSISIPVEPGLNLNLGCSKTFSADFTKTFTKVVKATIEDENEKNLEKSKFKSVETTQRLLVRKTINVPACTKYEVSSFVQVADNIEILYNVQFEITGRFKSSQRMTSDEIVLAISKQPRPNGRLQFIADHPRANKFSAIATSKLKIKARFGMNSVAHGEGSPMPGCECN
ncbi:unnamed protein product [Orchesella dallaii]|uniref:Uncharacterized protein n=1 Tax=Orchesella dallaii TaxID=48710 RepID=A0ABP1RS92_9HEXA